MALYKETPITGTSYQRAFEARFSNPLNAPPSVEFMEERVRLVDADTILRESVGSVSETMTDPAATFSLVDPVTLEPTQTTMTYGQIYLAAVSLYLHLANIRDTAPPPVEPPVEPPAP